MGDFEMLVSCEVYTSFASCYYISKTEDLKFVFLLVFLKTVEIMFQGKIVVNRNTLQEKSNWMN